jgi:hypothetical protein
MRGPSQVLGLNVSLGGPASVDSAALGGAFGYDVVGVVGLETDGIAITWWSSDLPENETLKHRSPILILHRILLSPLDDRRIIKHAIYFLSPVNSNLCLVDPC